MGKRIVVVLVLCVMSFTIYAQDAAKGHKKHKSGGSESRGVMLPPWAPAHNYDATVHAYFPDYYTYYDPNRGGYVYWKNGKYSFTPTVPPFLEKVDLGKSRIKLLKGLSLDLHPEENYPYYMKMNPADHENNLVPVPSPGGN